MSRLIQFLNNLKKLWSSWLLIGVLFLILAIPTRQLPNTIKKTTTHVLGITTAPTPTISVSPTDQTDTDVTTIFPTQAVEPTNTPIITSQTTTTTSQSSSIPTPTPAQYVGLQLQEPDGTFSYAVLLNQNADACGVLSEARNEGKLRSLTINDSYKATMHSSYVEEINGYRNNWTFTVNGTSPQGCSLYTPKVGDTIVWKYN